MSANGYRVFVNEDVIVKVETGVAYLVAWDPTHGGVITTTPDKELVTWYVNQVRDHCDPEF